jgi:hypothetical protein
MAYPDIYAENEQKAFQERDAKRRAELGKRLFMIHPKKARKEKMKKLNDVEAFLAGRR